MRKADKVRLVRERFARGYSRTVLAAGLAHLEYAWSIGVDTAATMRLGTAEMRGVEAGAAMIAERLRWARAERGPAQEDRDALEMTVATVAIVNRQ